MNLPTTLAVLFFPLCLWAQAPTVASHDWFVRPGTAPGDGSRAAPFNDPWRALEKCEAGDRVHVANGAYFGKLGTGTWEIPVDRVQLLGGYDAQFVARDPWQQPTKLCWDNTSKNWPKGERLHSGSRGVVVDGFVIDMQDQNTYLDEQKSGRTERPGETAVRLALAATVRNCVVINPGLYGIDCGAGSTIENNLVVNAIVWGIVVTGAVTEVDRATATIRNNTVLFAWDTQKAGGGGYGGAGVALRGPATVTDNLLAYCDNSAIYSVAEPSHLSIVGNRFWQNRFANLTAETGAQRAVIGDRDLEMLEEVGLASQSGNTVGDPELSFDPAWLGRTTKREAAAKTEKPAVAEPVRWGETKPLEMTKGIAPACSLPMALTLMRPQTSSPQFGARFVPLPAPIFATSTAPVTKAYEPCQLTDWNRAPAAKDGKPIEMLVAIGGVANISTMPSSYGKDEIAGVFLFDPDGKGERVTGFFRKGSTADRICSDGVGNYQGQGKPEQLHRVRGIAHQVAGVIKGAIFLETIERFEAVAVAVVRPRGRDWFVRAGAMGGDGSREKPFRDPFQPLERCEAGDTIHVAGGDYFGKLKAGHWSIGMPHIAMLGGYDQQFATRAPWQQPTRLFCPPDYQGRRGGYTLQGSGDHTGAVLDGFVFDKRFDNVYGEDGSLDVLHSDKTEHLWLSRPGCVVRNCLFLNGACGAVRVANGQTFANNVFCNHVTQTVWVEKGHTTDPFVFRDNTVLFAWTRRFGTGLGANGNLLRLCGSVRATVENNLFAYADNDAIRLETDPREITLRGNHFTQNLWSHLQQMVGWNAFDDRNFAAVGDLGFRACEGNQIAAANLALDATWLAKHQATRNQTLVTKPTAAAQAIAKATANPFDDKVSLPPPSTPSTDPMPAVANPFDETPVAKPAGAAAELFAPAYEWQPAFALFAANAAVGARVGTLAVEFAGVARVEAKHDYEVVTWDAARTADSWAKLGDRRVQLEVAIQRDDNQFQLPGVTNQDYVCFMVTGAAGTDSGLPMRCYVRKGTQTQRVFDQAKGFQTGKPLELHVIKGIAKERRQMIVEAAEKSR